jgi:ankyrin repeat protein
MKHLLLTTIAAVLVVGCGEGSRHLNLYEAAESGDIEAVKQHLADGTDIELKCPGCGSTALGHAAKHGHNEIAELLIENGADVSAKDDEGMTPLHIAASNGFKEIAELLIAEGADVNAKTLGDSTPLHYAAGEGHKEIVELLIAEGADVNNWGIGGGARGVARMTPLDEAIENDETEIADLLRKHGTKKASEL